MYIYFVSMSDNSLIAIIFLNKFFFNDQISKKKPKEIKLILQTGFNNMLWKKWEYFDVL